MKNRKVKVKKSDKKANETKSFENQSINDIEITEGYKQVEEKIKSGVPIILVNGGAGSGKTTFVDYIRERCGKNVVVIAPTGVAALNVKGVTIHSFCRFAPTIITDTSIQLVEEKRKFYSVLDLLIIDEISMVRADILDGIDKFLRINRASDLPFGGVQVLMIGDLFQLPPVINRSDREVFDAMGYRTQYFFSAKVLNQNPIAYVEFEKVFRQSDENFISILNKIRMAESLETVLPILNKRYLNGNVPNEGMLTLTCTNSLANQINDVKLNKLPGSPLTLDGFIIGKFPKMADDKLPSPIKLSLKVGAQVMFTKNDEGKRWVNGTLGTVVDITCSTDGPVIKVKVSSKYHESIVHDVERAEWKYYAYTMNYDGKIEQEVTGKYIQHPLMLAWAVTIHKSQGATLDGVLIDLGTGAFASGQVYVALSRCRSLEDIHLAKPIKISDIKYDPIVKRFYESIRRSGNQKG